MANLITLIAERDFQHEGRAVVRGEVFQAKPIDAAILFRARKVKFAPKGVTVPTPEQERPRRRYRRRDMTAGA